MNRDDIIRTGREARYPYTGLPWNKREVAFLERFAALVASAEREVCAKISEDFDKEHPQSNYGRCIAVKIRSRDAR